MFLLVICINGAGGTAAALDLLPARPATVQSYDTYRSWFVACDNALTCIAKGFGRGDEGAEMTIQREAGATGALRAFIRASAAVTLADVMIDGRPAGLAAAAWQVTTSEDETAITSSDLAAIRQLVGQLKRAWRITLRGNTVPLRGFSAAMLRMDSRQGRVGGVTALFRPGPAPATKVPAAPLLPRVPKHPITVSLASGEPERLIAALRASERSILDKEGCAATSTLMPAAYALGGTSALVLLPCIDGAYQSSALAFIEPRDGGPATQLTLRTVAPYARGIDLFTAADFDPQTGRLSMSSKGRGLGDCGISASWIWTGAAFQLAAFNLQKVCGGVEQGQWPALFRSVQ